MLDDIVEEARRIVAAGEARGIVLRLLGGLAIRLHSPSATHRALVRSYPDIDVVTSAPRPAPVEQLIAGLGYEPNKSFNLLNGASRLLFYDRQRERQIDVFIHAFEMCHRLPLAERLDREPLTIPLAELLLTKLQIVEINEKDIRDICTLLIDHPLGESDDERINTARIAELCGADWGLWKTVTLSLHKVLDTAPAFALEPEASRLVAERVDALRALLDTAPKSLQWKMRATIGERKQWYNLPEEVRRG